MGSNRKELFTVVIDCIYRIFFNIRRIGTGMYARPRPMLAGVYGKGL